MHPFRMRGALCAIACFVLPSLGRAAGPLPQASGVAPDVDFPSVLSRASGVVARPGALVGAGADYAARFDTGGFTFVPALGAAAREAMPVSYVLEDIRRDGVTVLDAEPVAPVQQGKLVVYGHGQGIEERYEVRPEGVHQTFLFPERPAGEGDLVVRGRLTTRLQSKSQAVGARFEQEGVGGVSWGGVTGVDALGQSAPGSVRRSGDVLELVLPANFVDQATYPLLLDPLIGAIRTVADDGFDEGNPDIAYLREADVFLIVWERRFAHNHWGICAQLMDSEGQPSGDLILLTPDPGFSELVTDPPSVAAIRKSGRFLVVWPQNAPGDPEVLVAASVNPANGAVSPQLIVSPSADRQNMSDVGGNRQLATNHGIVVWHEVGQGIYARTLDVPAFGAPVPVAPTKVLRADTGSVHHFSPSISKTQGNHNRSLVAWERVQNLSTARIEARLVAPGASPSGPPVILSDGNLALNHLQPSVDGDGRNWLVAWAREENSGTWDVVARSVTDQGAGAQPVSPLRFLASAPNKNDMAPSVAWLGSSALVSYSHEDVTGWVARAVQVDPYTAWTCQPSDEAATAAGTVYRTSIVGRWSGGDSPSLDGGAFLSFKHLAQPTGDETIQGMWYFAQEGPSDLGGATASGGTHVAPCPVEGNQNFRPQLFGSVPGRPVLFAISPSPMELSCGPGTWFPRMNGALKFWGVTDADGHADVSLPIPPEAVGLSFYAQWATKVPGGACPRFGGFELSNGLRLTIDP